jgi:hypothetical protein
MPTRRASPGASRGPATPTVPRPPKMPTTIGIIGYTHGRQRGQEAEAERAEVRPHHALRPVLLEHRGRRRRRPGWARAPGPRRPRRQPGDDARGTTDGHGAVTITGRAPMAIPAGALDARARGVDCRDHGDRPRAAGLAALAPAHVRELDAYQPGKPIEELERELGITGALKVASNENPLGPSPRRWRRSRPRWQRCTCTPTPPATRCARRWRPPRRRRRSARARRRLERSAVPAGAGAGRPRRRARDPGPRLPELPPGGAVAGRRFVATPATPLGADVDALIAGSRRAPSCA